MSKPKKGRNERKKRMPKKYEKMMDKMNRFEEEIKMGCTTTKGVVRPLTKEEIAYRKGFIETVRNVDEIKSGAQMGLLDPLYENKLSGITSAFACMRGEKKHLKRVKEQRVYNRLNEKYGSKKNK